MSFAAAALAFASLAFTAAAFVVARRELRALIKVRPQPLTTPLLVVIPARNEAERIRPTLRALLASDVAPDVKLDVLVVDDRSSDETVNLVEAMAASDSRLRLLRLDTEPAPGVFGKPRALAAAIEHARATSTLPERVLFLDADVVLERGALGAIVAALDETKADALSGVPKLVCESRVEQLFVPALASVVTGRFMPSKVHDDVDATAFLNGQLLLVKAAALDDAGGFGSVSHTVLEDVALARALKSRRRRLRLADLRAIASTRMYTSFAEIRAGFGKNARALLGASAASVGVLAFATSLFPWVALASAALDGDPGGIVHGLAIDAILANVALQLATRKIAGAPLWPVACLPVVYGGVALVIASGSSTTITWRGRSYSRQ
jgi:cellulose synthase/poly-beta-1,6-N-acetylglucosamine synthase-like glycosyltransferase